MTLKGAPEFVRSKKKLLAEVIALNYEQLTSFFNCRKLLGEQFV